MSKYEKYLNLLLSEKQRLEAELKILVAPESSQTQVADPNELADRLEDAEERRGTHQVLNARLNNIIRSLDKLKQGTYGTCEICSATLSDERLNANPAARTCKEHLDENNSLA